MKQVTKEQFWAFIMGAKYDILSSIDYTPYPYTSLFKTTHNNLVGRKVERYESGISGPVIADYFLSETA